MQESTGTTTLPVDTHPLWSKLTQQDTVDIMQAAFKNMLAGHSVQPAIKIAFNDWQRANTVDSDGE